MEKNSISWMTILMVAIVNIGFVSCGGDDEKNGLGYTNNEVIVQLMSHKWYCSTTEFNETSYGGYTYTQQWTVYFYNETEGVIHCKTIDRDTDLGTSREENDYVFSYDVSSDGTQIFLSKGSNFKFDFYGDFLLEGEDIFEKQSLSSSDYKYMERFFGSGDIDIVNSNTPDVSGSINGHEYVDLGLSVKWAVCNIGANSPEGYGNYYAWGETIAKEEYDFKNYSFVFYEKASVPVPGRIPYLMDDISGTSYDVARSQWGSTWRMPTSAEFNELAELAEKNKGKWITYKGTSGLLLTARNGKSIFFPAAGYKEGKSLEGCGIEGEYWTSNGSKESTAKGHYPYSGNFYFWNEKLENLWTTTGYRPNGISVRAVSK